MTIVSLAESDRSRLLLGNSIQFSSEDQARLGVVIHPIIRLLPSVLISDSFLLLSTDNEVAFPPYDYVLYEVLQNNQIVLEPVIDDQLSLRKALDLMYTLNDSDLRYGLAEATLEIQESNEALRIKTMNEILSIGSIAAPFAHALSAFKDDEYVKTPGSKHSPKVVFIAE